jgi:DNA-binding transcriptional regulator YhcF (GntR family)
MKPVDYRNETFDQVKGRMDATRAALYNAMLADGRALTTREIAALTGVDLLTVRPRVTELVQMGFVECESRITYFGFNPQSAIPNPQSREGRYRALSHFEALRVYEGRARIARDPQLQMVLV